MSHELYGCLALTGPGGANVRVSRHWHSAQELTTLTVMEMLEYLGIVRGQSASTQEHAHHTKWVFTLICTYIFISHTGQNSVALLQYGVAFWYILKQRENVALFLCIDILLTFPTCTKSFTMCFVNSSTKLPQRLLYLSSEGIYEGYCQLNVCGKQIWAGAETRR